MDLTYRAYFTATEIERWALFSLFRVVGRVTAKHNEMSRLSERVLLMNYKIRLPVIQLGRWNRVSCWIWEGIQLNDVYGALLNPLLFFQALVGKIEFLDFHKDTSCTPVWMHKHLAPIAPISCFSPANTVFSPFTQLVRCGPVGLLLALAVCVNISGVFGL